MRRFYWKYLDVMYPSSFNFRFSKRCALLPRAAIRSRLWKPFWQGFHCFYHLCILLALISRHFVLLCTFYFIESPPCRETSLFAAFQKLFHFSSKTSGKEDFQRKGTPASPLPSHCILLQLQIRPPLLSFFPISFLLSPWKALASLHFPLRTPVFPVFASISLL